MSKNTYIPTPVFDTMAEVLDQYQAVYADDHPRGRIRQWLVHCLQSDKKDKKTPLNLPQYVSRDYQLALNFLYSYRGSPDTFTAYRRELERLLQWSWFVREQSVLKHKREDIEAFIEFCIKPPKRWIGLKNVARFKLINAEKVPNKEWRNPQIHSEQAR